MLTALRCSATGLDTLVTVVHDIAQTDAVLFDNQIFTAITDLKRIIMCSTLSPVYVRALRARPRTSP